MQMQRSSDEPISPATVVSILPYGITESKPEIIPRSFTLPEVPKGECRVIAIDYVERSYFVDSDRGSIAFAENPRVVARSVVDDHIKASLSVTNGAQPGLFWVVGVHENWQEIPKKFPTEFAAATKMQDTWFRRLVKVADDSWQRFHQHRMISDMHRRAAVRLGLTNRQWAEEVNPEDQLECPFCRSLVPIGALVCRICRGPVDMKKLEAMPAAVRQILFGNLNMAPPQQVVAK